MSKKLVTFLLLTAMLFSILTVFPVGIPVSAAQAGTGTYKVTTSAGLNIRSGPGSTYSRIGVINYGANFTVTQTSKNEWGYASSPYNGWVSLDYAQLIQSSSNTMTSSNLPNGYYRMVSKLDSSKVIDIEGAVSDNGTRAILYRNNGGDNQIFYFERLSDGTYRIQAKHSGRYLEIRNSSHNNEAEAAQWDWHDSYACKRWYVLDCGNEYYKLINKESGKVLDVYRGNTADRTRIQQYQDNGGDNQRFKLAAVSTSTSNQVNTWENMLGKTMGSIKNSNGTYAYAYGSGNMSYNGGYVGECTWYAYGRFLEVHNIALKTARHARYWLDENANDSRLSVTYDKYNISDKSIAVKTSSTYGHVIFVEYVQRDGNGNPLTVYYTECNTDNNSRYNAGSDCILKKLSFNDFISQKSIAGYVKAK